MTGDNTGDSYYERLVDETQLRDFLAEELGPAGEMTVAHHQEGHSNETLFVTWDDREFVVRRPPPGETAESAHDVLREYRVISSLQDTDIPVPRSITYSDDHGIIGSDFYVVERLEGDVLRDEEPDRFASTSSRRGVGEELVDTLSAIHTLDYEAQGLGDFGSPEGFTERQVSRWRKQLRWAFDVTADEREIPELDRVGDWLEQHVPESHEHTLVHGDYKLDNVMYGPGLPPEIVGVFDWELSTLGDPLTDLGWLLLFWYDEPEGVLVPELQSTFMAADGYPTKRELIDRYEQETGIHFRSERFYRTLAVYKLAGLGEMFFRRYLEGNSDDPLYPVMEDRVPTLASAAIDIIEGESPI